MKSVYKVFLLILLASPYSFATHVRGGEIMATHVSGQNYQIKVRLYFDLAVGEGAATAQSNVLVCFGDGSTKEFQRTKAERIPGNVLVSDYDGMHTYPSSGQFQISVSLENRTPGILNFPNSGDTKAFFWTVINTQVSNSTPVLPYLVFEGGVRQLFKIDLKATVADVDSFTVTLPKLSKPSPGECGVRMLEHGYMYPNEVSSKGTFKVIPNVNQLVWQAPEVLGNYIFAMVVSEWRDGIIISESYREGLITVIDKPGPTVEIPPYESAENGGLITSTPNVKSAEVSMAIVAYPVPTESFVTVKAYSKKRSIVTLQLIDSNGRVLREIKSGSPVISVQEEFDLRNLAKGLYIIKASNEVDAVSQKVIR
ncbi:T9SS type A sorting domain-containing protein [Dyadobacter fanqingshengii]|uniref:T9SS type A sorting domain-containing protein n=1 Tax=Dyadobacter fanqingshengii TaxID=2906443 RepID=A0A9X1PDN5_9BACT|nr:T9SS type A sorting domain-containing protein [Dyadobacter fanqingshengii]MCF0041783.1 T9SS type A sorting domain-containing protein [Dyadobacter fanqingshengii]USJ36505.1 T9SS type A sorting domain-containing protein [Dyadobacter fanqingshengii]